MISNNKNYTSYPLPCTDICTECFFLPQLPLQAILTFWSDSKTNLWIPQWRCKWCLLGIFRMQVKNITTLTCYLVTIGSEVVAFWWDQEVDSCLKISDVGHTQFWVVVEEQWTIGNGYVGEVSSVKQLLQVAVVQQVEWIQPTKKWKYCTVQFIK